VKEMGCCVGVVYHVDESLQIKKKVHHAHPNIYLIIEVLQNTQEFTECTIIQYAAEGAHPPKRRRYRVIDTRHRYCSFFLLYKCVKKR
jgi:hypothetical protein